MNYKNIILNKLLDKYEASKSVTSESNRRIILKISELKEYDIEDYEIKQIFHDSIFELKKEQLIDYSWKQHEKGNILKEIWLNKENVNTAYLKTGRKHIRETNTLLVELLENSKFKQDWMEDYRKEMIQYVKIKNRPNSLFPLEFAKDILKILKEIDNGQENLKRVLSIRCFGDSKYFEKNIEHVLIRIIKKYLLDNYAQEEYCNDDVLLEVRNFKIS